MATAKTILRPLAQVGTFVFDAELSNSRGDVRDFSERRIPQGGSIVDHSMLNPGGRRFTLSGRCSNLSQPQNIGRPGAAAVTDQIEALINNTAAGLIGQSTRLQDAEDLLRAQIIAGQEVVVVSKKFGKILAVVLSWSAQDGPTDHYASTYQVEMLEILRAGGLFYTSPSSLGDALNGSAATNDKGPTTAVDTAVDFLP